MLAQTDHSHPRHLALPSPIPSNTGPTHSEVGLWTLDFQDHMSTARPGGSPPWDLGSEFPRPHSTNCAAFTIESQNVPSWKGPLRIIESNSLSAAAQILCGRGLVKNYPKFTSATGSLDLSDSAPLPPPISSTLPKRSPGISSWSRGFIPSRHFRLYFSLLMDFLDTGVQSRPENSQKTKVILFPNQYPWLAVT